MSRSQLALPLSLKDRGVFESFWAADNVALVSFLMRLAGPDAAAAATGCWIWGSAATGKTHLLHALCERLGDDAVYVPLGQLAGAGPVVLDDLARRRCICLDDVDAVAGEAAFELALFGLMNQVADRQGLLVASARAAPRDSDFALADLQSRLTRLPVFHLAPLDEPGRIAALKLRAAHRGLDLPEETARFMLNRSRRDMNSLYRLLDRLDAEALAAQRRLTIPFVRDVLRAE